MIVKNMSSDPKLGIIYREIVKVAKANLCVKAKPSWSWWNCILQCLSRSDIETIIAVDKFLQKLFEFKDRPFVFKGNMNQRHPRINRVPIWRCFRSSLTYCILGTRNYSRAVTTNSLPLLMLYMRLCSQEAKDGRWLLHHGSDRETGRSSLAEAYTRYMVRSQLSLSSGNYLALHILEDQAK